MKKIWIGLQHYKILENNITLQYMNNLNHTLLYCTIKDITLYIAIEQYAALEVKLEF